jgi:hypothetical protein
VTALEDHTPALAWRGMPIMLGRHAMPFQLTKPGAPGAARGDLRHEREIARREPIGSRRWYS